jgi:hypothetical protein
VLLEPSGALDLAYLDASTNALHQSRSIDGGKTVSNGQVLWTTMQDAVTLTGAVGPQGANLSGLGAGNGGRADLPATFFSAVLSTE